MAKHAVVLGTPQDASANPPILVVRPNTGRQPRPMAHDQFFAKYAPSLAAVQWFHTHRGMCLPSCCVSSHPQPSVTYAKVLGFVLSALQILVPTRGTPGMVCLARQRAQADIHRRHCMLNHEAPAYLLDLILPVIAEIYCASWMHLNF